MRQGVSGMDVFLVDAGGMLVYHGTIDDNAENAAAVKQHILRDALEAVSLASRWRSRRRRRSVCTIKLSAS